MSLHDLIKLVGEPPEAGGSSTPSTGQTAGAAAPLRIDPNAADGEDDRFSRFRLIGWWDQKKLAAARVLVVGAGALGNEIVKNLCLLGIGQILIVDLDTVENSNLSRSVLYRAKDNGTPKAAAAARAASDLYPAVRVQPVNANVVYDLGLGVYRWADVVIGGLDNREARLSINRACLRFGKTWIDGAIEQITGTARVFAPDGPCYECTMSETDWRLLQLRRSCNLLSRTEMAGGKTPTTPTISSIIAGVQTQEAVKLLHGLPTLAGRGLVFEGLSAEAYQVEFQRKDSCMSHEPLDEVVELDVGSEDMTLRELLGEARRLLGDGAELELARDVLEKLVCPTCGQQQEMFVSMGKVLAEAVWCPHCRQDGRDVRREVVTFYKVRGNEPFLDRTPAAIGLPPFDVLIARHPSNPGRAIGLELSCDAKNVLGPLWEGGALEWA